MIPAAFRIIKSYWGVILLSALFFWAGLLRLNDLCLYTPDSSRYLIWGASIAHGEGFVDATQPEADRVVVHAPLYSLLTAPVQMVLPLSLEAVKVFTLLWGVAVIMLFFLWVRKLAGTPQAYAAVVLLVCNPLLLLYSTEVLSEAPFVAGVLMMFFLFESSTGGVALERFKTGAMIAAGALLPLLREVGIAATIALVAYLVLRKEYTRAALVGGAAVLLSIGWQLRNDYWISRTPGSQSGNMSLVLQHFVTPPDTSMFVEIGVRMWLNVRKYALQLGGMINYPLFATHQVNLIVDPSVAYVMVRGFFSFVQYPVALLGAILIWSGIIRDRRESRTALARLVFLASYVAVVLAYPIHDIRFLMPLIPVLLFYAVKGSSAFARFFSDQWIGLMRRAGWAVCMVSMIPNLLGIGEILKTNLLYREHPEAFGMMLRSRDAYPPMFTQPWTLLGTWIESHVEEGAVFATPSKELSTITGGRKVLELEPGLPLPLFESLLRDHRVDYLLAPVRWSDLHVYEFQMKESRRLQFRQVVRISNLALFRIMSANLSHDSDASGNEPVSLDTTSVTGLLRTGRADLVAGDIRTAVRYLDASHAAAPLQPEVVYQDYVAHLFAGDPEGANRLQQELITLPQAGSYIFLARAQRQAAELLQAAATAKWSEVRAVKTFEAASAYWKLGYPQRAYAVMNNGIESDTTYFNGLLWSLHFSLQTGDTATAKRRLRQLDIIDSTNVVVVAFRQILELGDALHGTANGRQRSELHLRLSDFYRDIDLKEEAIDEAERAVGADSASLRARLVLAECFQQKSRFRTALRYYSDALRVDPGNQNVRHMVDSLSMHISSLQ